MGHEFRTARKTVVLTGATDGIGRVVASRIGAHGHRLVLLARDPAKAERVCGELRGEGAEAAWIRCDLTSLAGVRAAAGEVLAREPRVDVLVNGAARFGSAREETVDGFEAHLGVNYLAPFLLTHLLLPRLASTGGARVVQVSGETARFARIDLDDLDRRRSFDVLSAYGQSKLALILLARALAARLDPAEVTCNAMHPGPAATGHLSAGPRWLHALWSTLLPGPAWASRGVVRLALAPSLEGISGRYYLNGLRAPPPCAAFRDELVERLYRRSAELVGVAPLPRRGES